LQTFVPKDGIATVEYKKAGSNVHWKQYTVIELLVAKGNKPACIHKHLLNMHGAAVLFNMSDTLQKLKTGEEPHANCRVIALALQYYLTASAYLMN
jgi:hypothetical protein